MSESGAITRRSGSNLAAAFILLPAEKQAGMSALYAFCREVDDIADEERVAPEVRATTLEEWRADVRRACDGGAPDRPVVRELQPVIARYRLPFALFDELIRGVEMDLLVARYETYSDLELYCYRVASVVGLLSIEIFGYTDPACREYAIQLGKALQFTNILRDVRRDAERGRIYLPLEELRRHGALEQEILALRCTPPFQRAAAAMATRAWGFYRAARASLPAAELRRMATAELMASVYGQLLRKLERRRFDVFGPHLTRLSRLEKMLLLARTWFRVSLGTVSPRYGTP